MTSSFKSVFMISLLVASLSRPTEGDKFSFERLLDTSISFLVGQKSEDPSSAPRSNEDFLTQDNTNEDIATFTAQEIIFRSGYDYEIHSVVSDDHYITKLIRIINPLADRSRLKRPPVMMMHGGITDNNLWIWSSAIQHQPERWPRTVEDGPITSWNKSLAFVLANNGYDVWLCGTRGSNLQNKGHAQLKDHLNWFDKRELANKEGQSDDTNFSVNFEENFKYWNFTMDDIGRYEVVRQQEKILEVTGSDRVTLVDVSFSTTINLALMSENPQFVSRLHNYVTVAPILNSKGTNLAIKTFQHTSCTKWPLPIGIILNQIILSPPLRAMFARLNSHKELRYTVGKQVSRVIAGPSAQYETNLDSGVGGHIFMATGYKELRHWCQQMIAGRLQKFDYGLTGNVRAYGTVTPPKYDLSKIDMPNWLLVSGGNDKLAPVASIKQLLTSVKRMPDKHIHIKRYNHLDLIAAVENDKYVNLPVLQFLDNLCV